MCKQKICLNKKTIETCKENNLSKFSKNIKKQDTNKINFKTTKYKDAIIMYVWDQQNFKNTHLFSKAKTTYLTINCFC